MKRNSSSETWDFKTLKVTRPREYVVNVELNRPEKRNAMNSDLWSEIRACFLQLATDADCRAVVLSGAGKMFTAGLDLTDAILQETTMSDADVGRKAFSLRRNIALFQESFTVIEKCPKPVIAAVHSACLGAGIDMISACDIRYCSSDAWFTIKEVDLGLAADVGTLQRFPKVIGNDSLARELALTARNFFADEAKEMGFVSRIFPDKEQLIEGALDLASTIASKSPIAVQGTKISMVYARDHSVADSLEHVLTWNQAMLQSEDVKNAIMANMQKQKPVFSKL
ncbi:hypothetical protein C0Q70_13202 [Pomacea canaliculata]|uniref:Delta(3,5)-Delta(2,4)-dienoyl-CoA isomerase, mitochondrial n=2 Tax=Pomacea canaliculata TaxID=400727 RepID=A0A2T7NWL4_POMCA|nr:hypothetical protein C0Q70_13202 [Pomacea canaliculata]